jgi:integrase
MRGHVRRRGAKWCVVVDVGRDEDGQRRQKWHGGFTTRRAAQQALTEILGHLQQGTYAEPCKQTLATFMHEWLASIRASVRPSTWAAYKMLAEAHILPALGMTPVQRLTASRLNSFYGDLLENGRRDGGGPLSARTVRYCHATIHKALADGVRMGLVARNVAQQATPPAPSPRQELRTWTAEELRGFLESVQDDRLYAAYVLAGTTGLRRGEVLGLPWHNLDLDAGRLAVTQTLIPVGYAITYGTPKTAKGRRSVALDAFTVNALRAHRRRQLEERLALGLGMPGEDALVFTALDGSPLHPNQFSASFDRLVKAAGLPRIRLHDLRHTHATLALQAGVHPKVVSERLGHANIAITLDCYSHAIPALQEEAAAKVAKLVFGG